MKTLFSRLATAIPAMTLAYAFSAGAAHADLVLETETAQLGAQGQSNLSNALQVEHESDGTRTILTETQWEYAITDRSEILFEPFFYEKIMPRGGPSTDGVGDVEVTYSYEALTERGARPAFILAQKVKIPTASNRDIGTGEFDYTSYVIVGKTWGRVELNFNLGYEFVGNSSTTDFNDQVIHDLSIDFPVGEKTVLFAEEFGNSSPEHGASGTEAISFGAEYQLTEHANVFVAAADDSDDLQTFRIGFNIRR